MGYGDEIMATGMARGAASRGKRIAFGDGRKIIWGRCCKDIFRNNRNVAQPGSEHASDLQWIKHYAGSRLYGRLRNGFWVFNQDFRVTPGEMFFDPEELAFADTIPNGTVIIEPHIKATSVGGGNKSWGFSRYELVAKKLMDAGLTVVQLSYGGQIITGAKPISSPTFRQALAAIARSALYIGPEGGLHHGAAAVGTPAIVIFGGFNDPKLFGYPTHTNIFSGGIACGSQSPCQHCIDAMKSITVDQVYDAAIQRLSR